MNLTINPLEFKNAFYGNNIKKDTTPNNNNNNNNYYYEGSKIDGSSAITSYATASINLKKGASEKPKKQTLSGDEFFINMAGYEKNEDWAKKC